MPPIAADTSFLAVIDAQPGFYRNRDDVDDAAFATFVDRAAWIVGVAAAMATPIVVTVERPDRNGTTADAIAAQLPLDTPVFAKSTFDLASNDSIRAAVEHSGRRTAVLVGMETDVCVAQSAVGLLDLGYRVAAVTDAIFSPGAAHRHGLERLRGAGVELVSAKGLFYEWMASVDAVGEFKRAHPALARPRGIEL